MDAHTPDGAIEFWFDFGSAYAYFAALGIDALAERVGRPVLWRPYMLGTAFKATGARGLSSTPLKSDYALRDWQRLARLHGVPFSPPSGHPTVALAATRAFYHLEEEAPDLARRFAAAMFASYYRGEKDAGNAQDVADICAALGADRAAVLAALDAPGLKARTREIGEGAVARGIFGSPFFVVDGEPFFGADRMAMMEDWIRRGGW
ncbi:2-hydroxychromene-2-carboxylate isomerase [Stappia sp.]|uniref:2-hydroxychromene-2-carboxylate isomerase n=1 Tax=Stappia sp. TaxID=1870903 RepID=UPI003A996AAC